MKILAVSDIHSDRGLVEKIRKIIEKEKPDLIILAGDITWFNNENPNVIGPILEITRSTNSRVLFIPGNHEDPSLAELWEVKYKYVQNLHGKVLDLDRVIIAGIGGGNMPIFDVTEEDIKMYLEYIKKHFAEKSDDKITILVSHIHPNYTFSSSFGEGSKILTEFILNYKPHIVIFGHMHEGGGIEEKLGDSVVINVARFPKIIEIDENKREIKIRNPKT